MWIWFIRHNFSSLAKFSMEVDGEKGVVESIFCGISMRYAHIHAIAG